MAAFQRAVDLGYRYLETDVRVTADGVALAFHDSTLDRVTDGHGALDRLPWRAVRAARIDGREPIPLLEDVLAAWPDVRVNLDVKADRGVGAAVAAIRRTGVLDRVCVGAFSTRRIRAVRRALGAGLTTSLGPGEVLALRAASGPLAQGPARLASRGWRGRCAQVPPRAGRLPVVDRAFLRTAHRLGVAVHVWTVNEAAEMTRLLDLGVDGLMTDRADLLRDVLRERGAW